MKSEFKTYFFVRIFSGICLFSGVVVSVAEITTPGFFISDLFSFLVVVISGYAVSEFVFVKYSVTEESIVIKKLFGRFRKVNFIDIKEIAKKWEDKIYPGSFFIEVVQKNNDKATIFLVKNQSRLFQLINERVTKFTA